MEFSIAQHVLLTSDSSSLALSAFSFQAPFRQNLLVFLNFHTVLHATQLAKIQENQIANASG